MKDLTPRARQLMEEVTVGDRSPDDPEVVALAKSDEAFGARLTEMEQVTRLVARAASEERKVQEAAASLVGAPGEDRLRETIERDERTSTSPFAVAAVLVALAAGLLLWLGPWTHSKQEPESPIYMGTRLEIRRPSGRVRSYAPIEWSSPASLPTGGVYKITVSALDGGVPAPQPLLEHRTQERSWTPTDDELARLGTEVWITVQSLGPDGSPLASTSTLAELDE